MRTIPAINQAWPEQGGIYIGARLINGVAHHVVIPGGVEHDAKDIKFDDAAASIPKDLNGHADWRLPEKEDLMLAYINGREHFEKSGRASIYWSSTEEDEDWAWAVVFEDGVTDCTNRSYEFRVRPFRSFTDSSL